MNAVHVLSAARLPLTACTSVKALVAGTATQKIEIEDLGKSVFKKWGLRFTGFSIWHPVCVLVFGWRAEKCMKHARVQAQTLPPTLPHASIPHDLVTHHTTSLSMATSDVIAP